MEQVRQVDTQDHEDIQKQIKSFNNQWSDAKTGEMCYVN